MREEAFQLLESFSENTIFKRAQKILQEPEKYSLKEIQEVESNLQEDLIPNFKELRFNLFLASAQKGDIAAQSQIGDWYLRGIGVAVNNEEAFKWIYKAHQQDNWYAHYQMGYLYESGIVVEKDLQKALELYQASLQEITMVPKYINGRLNPEYDSLYKSCNEDSLVALERVRQLMSSKSPKWMFWKRK
ncbi:MAG: sel1 repeat family protein [Moraxellaceae bacterium]|nr:sel1 repeat family protein [Moraxellaceae bacterium]